MNRQKEITQAYWSPERVERDAEHNPSGDRAAGDAFVDTLTLAELVEFFETNTAGPTYCMVKDRILSQLEKLPPKLDIASARRTAVTALEALRGSIARLVREAQ